MRTTLHNRSLFLALSLFLRGAIACEDGYYGDQCKFRCGEGCLYRRCQLHPTKGIGICTDGCEKGTWGSTCKIRCSSGCVDNDCLSESGICTCKDGYWGEQCDKTCPVRCVKCHRNTGECTECIKGFFGSKCEDCSFCRSSCDSLGCTAGCLTGYYGRFCHVPCYPHCRLTDQSKCFVQRNAYDKQRSMNCTSQCDQETGHCLHGCEVGYFGLSCDLPCSENCLASSCGHLGRCLHGCQLGYFGTLCELKCSNYCLNHQCHRINDDCNDGCEPGVYGPQCNSNCTNCKINQCHQGTGECDECETGFYGWRCNKKCRFQCSEGTCHRYEGTCVSQKPSHVSITSSQEKMMTTIPVTTPDPNTTTAVVITMATFVTVCAVITVSIFICKRMAIKGIGQSKVRRRPQYPIPPLPDATHHYEFISEFDKPCPSNSGMCQPAEYEDINEISRSNRRAWGNELSSSHRYPCQNTERADVNKSSSPYTGMIHIAESLSLPNLSINSGHTHMTSQNTYLTITGDRRNSTP